MKNNKSFFYFVYFVYFVIFVKIIIKNNDNMIDNIVTKIANICLS